MIINHIGLIVSVAVAVAVAVAFAARFSRSLDFRFGFGFQLHFHHRLGHKYFTRSSYHSLWLIQSNAKLVASSKSSSSSCNESFLGGCTDGILQFSLPVAGILNSNVGHRVQLNF